jgi:uncharacterized membrane protein YkvA (DUF1232 family)
MRKWKQVARHLKAETYAVYLAMKHPRTPWPARVVGACVVAYALSPIDLIPDYIPVLGYVDDLILVPLGVALTMRMVPPEVMAECRARAAQTAEVIRPRLWIAAAIVATIWILFALLVAWLVIRLLRPH